MHDPDTHTRIAPSAAGRAALVLAVAVLFSSMAAIVVGAALPHGRSATLVGSAAPALSLRTAGGDRVTLAEAAGGHALLLVFGHGVLPDRDAVPAGVRVARIKSSADAGIAEPGVLTLLDPDADAHAAFGLWPDADAAVLIDPSEVLVAVGPVADVLPVVSE